MPPTPKAEIVAEIDGGRLRFYTASPDALATLLAEAPTYGSFHRDLGGDVGPHMLYVAPLYDLVEVARHFAGKHVTLWQPESEHPVAVTPAQDERSTP